MSARDDLERLYRTQGPRLWRAILLSFGDREVADDAVAEAFAQALRRGEALLAPDRWVWRAAYRIAAGELMARRSLISDFPAVTVDEAPREAVELMDALRSLSPKQRSSVVLHHYAGYSVREVAAIIGSTPAAVGVHLSRGRARLRRELEVADA